MASSAYWRKRFELLEQKSNEYGLDAFRQIEPAFINAEKEIQKEIESWYGRYAKNNNVSMTEARRQLSTKELKEFRWDVNEYIKYGRENAIDPKWMKELENASARVHINRLEALKIRTQQAAEAAFGNELDVLDAMARKVYTEDYYHSIFEMHKGFGVGWNIGQVDERKLNQLISKPWAADGKNFSQRIWNHRDQLVNELHTQMTQNCILGKHPKVLIDSISKKFNTTKGQAGRLVMTEQAFFHSAAQKDAFKELDVEEFEVVATLDGSTSDICQDMDGKHFPMSQYEPGVTAPPFHVWCRTVTAPYFEDNFGGERAARSADGKTYYVPDTMKYKDWKEHFVDKTKDPADWLKPASVVDVVNMITSFSQVKDALLNEVGFDMVENSFIRNVDKELAIDNTNQLIRLERKFGVVHKSTGSICSESSGQSQGYVSHHLTQPLKQNLSLCPKYFKNKVEHVNSLIGEKKSNWAMPFSDEKASVYVTTHEYGHMLQHVLIQERMVQKGWSKAKPHQFVNYNRKTQKAMYKWYFDVEKEIHNECFKEIVEIAKRNNPNFKVTHDVISDYGCTNKAEFFAEVFANSQLGEPNELGNAMNIWLEERGLIK